MIVLDKIHPAHRTRAEEGDDTVATADRGADTLTEWLSGILG